METMDRKASKRFEEEVFPGLKKQIDEAAHFEVPVEVDWSSLAEEGSGHLYREAWPKIYFTPFIEALKAIAVDEPGREVLRSTLKRVVIRNTTGTFMADKMVSFQEGVLTLDHEPISNQDKVQERQEAIQKALEGVPQDGPDSKDPLAAFLRWNARGVDATLSVLQKLSGRQQAGIPVVIPDMTLLLRSGRDVTGILHEVMEDDREGRAALVSVPRGEDLDVVIVPVGTIEAISVHFVRALGALERDASATPSPLQLRRQLAKLETQLRELLENTIIVGLAPDTNATSAAELRALGFLADRAREVLEALARDNIGRSALREKVQRILLRVADSSSFSLADQALELVSGRHPVDWYSRQELEQAVHSAL